MGEKYEEDEVSGLSLVWWVGEWFSGQSSVGQGMGTRATGHVVALLGGY